MKLFVLGFCLIALFCVAEQNNNFLEGTRVHNIHDDESFLGDIWETLFGNHQQNKHWEFLQDNEPYEPSPSSGTKTFIVNLLPHHQTMDAEIRVGTQKIMVTFDTGAVHSWITDPYQCHLSPTCKKTEKEKTFYYGGGDVSGVSCTDHIIISDKNVSTFEFLRAAKNKVKIETISKSTGFIGLRPHNSESNFLRALRKQKLIGTESFSLYLNPESPKIIFGGYDPSLKRPDKDFRYVNFLKDNNWSIEATSLTLALPKNKKTSLKRKLNLMFDSGANYIYVSKNLYKFFKENINFVEGKFYTREEVDINFRTMTFATKMSDGKDLPLYIRPLYFMLQHDKDKYSFGIKLDANLKENQMIMGFAFLRDYYMHFDFQNNRIGFTCGVKYDYKNTLTGETYC